MSNISKRLPVGKQKGVSNNTTITSRTNVSGGMATASKSASMRSTGFVSPTGKSSSVGDEDTANRSKPSHVWLENHTITEISTGDQTTVNLVITDTVFPRVKFVGRDTDLVFTTETRSICQFVIGQCNVHADISPADWWRHTQKYISQTFNRLRNDRNTAMKWAMLGKRSKEECWLACCKKLSCTTLI